MCEDFSIEAPDLPIWNRQALDCLRDEYHPTTDEFVSLLKVEEDEPAFDPIKVRDLLREEHAAGLEPELLILGRFEMASFRHFVSRGFGEESGSPLGGLYFLGIPVVADASPTRLEFVVEEDLTTNDPTGRNAA